ncbi:MAG TPA: SEC-C metal-binding domain-containing protein [Blastocatellia bacterium]|nr:SEC-C metal-binding domain-containing protein [Blastocatellia bacterium]
MFLELLSPQIKGRLRGRLLWPDDGNSTKSAFNERTSKRRKGYPSETNVRRGFRLVHGDKELIEKLGRNDLCPCGSGRRFQEMLPEDGPLRRVAA